MEDSPWSPEVRVLLRPYRTFRELAASAPDARPLLLALRRPLFFLLVGAAFVSLSTAGRLVLGHLFWSTLSLGFVVLLHVLVLALTLAVTLRRRLRARDLDLYFVARAPWTFLLTLLGAWLVLVVEEPLSIFGLFLGGPMPFLLLGVTLWSTCLDHAYFRAALGLSGVRAALATLLAFVLYFALGLLWYVVTDQLGPLLASGGD
jgi:hypothetical protein